MDIAADPFSLAFLGFIWPLLLAALAAGLVDSIGGGGGLMTVPTLLNLGLPPALILGTNKSMSTFGSLPAVLRYARAGLMPRLHLRTWLLLIGGTIIFALLGAVLSQQAIVLQQLSLIIPVLLIAVMAFMLKRWFWDERRPRKVASLGTEEIEAQLRKKILRPRGLLGINGIAFYDGLFGPGCGTFFLSFFESLGVRTITANAITKVFNLSSNIGALIWFGTQGKVIWAIGLSGASCYLLGNYLGAGLVLKRGQKLVRIVVLTATSFLILRYLIRML